MWVLYLGASHNAFHLGFGLFLNLDQPLCALPKQDVYRAMQPQDSGFSKVRFEKKTGAKK